MNIQEQEEQDFHPGTDLQNAFALSRMENEQLDAKIGEALSRGKHVVVLNYPAYCPRTDAAMGENQSYVSEHETRKDAVVAAALENEGLSMSDEAYFTVSSSTVLMRRNGDFYETEGDSATVVSSVVGIDCASIGGKTVLWLPHQFAESYFEKLRKAWVNFVVK